MASEKAQVRHCLLCKFDKGSTAAVECRKICQVYGEDAIDDSHIVDISSRISGIQGRRQLSRSGKKWAPFTCWKTGFRSSHKLQPESSQPKPLIFIAQKK